AQRRALSLRALKVAIPSRRELQVIKVARAQVLFNLSFHGHLGMVLLVRLFRGERRTAVAPPIRTPPPHRPPTPIYLTFRRTSRIGPLTDVSVVPTEYTCERWPWSLKTV